MFFFLSCACYAFVCVCLYVPCGHLLGKGWPLGSHLWCLTVSCHFPIGILGQVWYLIVSIPDLCTLTYFATISLRKRKLVVWIKQHQRPVSRSRGAMGWSRIVSFSGHTLLAL